MMSITLTCNKCGSAVHVHPSRHANTAQCPICEHDINLTFTQDHEQRRLVQCPCCQRKDFYSQKDFNRKIGVFLFVLAAIASIWTYGLSFVVLYLFDLFLFKKLKKIAICYKCQTIFREVLNIDKIGEFNHEMNDRIIYAGHDFDGQPHKN